MMRSFIRATSLHAAFATALGLVLVPAAAEAAFITFEAAGATGGDIVATRDAFRAAVGGGTVAGANGSFGGLRREINWDGVPDTLADPNLLPANFFNVNSPRGAVFSTPGTGFLVSANAGLSTPTLFGFANEFQVFSPQRLFTAVSSTITDVRFFLPGTSTPATTSAFAAVFVGVEVPSSKLEFFDIFDQIIYSRTVLIAGSQGLSFAGAVAAAGERIARVRLTSGANAILANGVRGNSQDDEVVMDDFLFAEPVTQGAVPEPSSVTLLAFGALVALRHVGRTRRHR